MSGRALRRLREEREAEQANALDHIHDEDETDDDEEAVEDVPVSKSAFALMGDSSSDEEDGDDEEEEEEVESAVQKEDIIMVGRNISSVALKKADGQESSATQSSNGKECMKGSTVGQDESKAEDEEDLDELLAEFETRDQERQKDEDVQKKMSAKPVAFPLILQGFQVKDLDIDYVMRTNVLMGAGGVDDAQPGVGEGGRGGRRGAAPSSVSCAARQNFLFGSPRSDWHRPPHYVGGGLGMTTYDSDAAQNQNGGNDRSIPWPYNDTHKSNIVPESCRDERCWFTFLQSDTYQKDLEDYRQVQQSGDANALALFVAHHPFVTDALLQLAMLLYLTNQSQEGLLMLRRSLWIYECASIKSFVTGAVGASSVFMDYRQRENETFFTLLFRMIHVSAMSGCTRTSLAVSRYVLSLDPLRDPTGVLLIMDFYALLLRSKQQDEFIVKLVESGTIPILHRDEHKEDDEYVGSLTDLPNWAFSYALALYRLGSDKVDDEDIKGKANKALQIAIRTFPHVVNGILKQNEVDVHGRSTRIDWPSILPTLEAFASSKPQSSSDLSVVVQHATRSTAKLIIKIFLHRHAKGLWADSNVLDWLFQCSEAVVNELKEKDETDTETSNSDEGARGGPEKQRNALHPCILRYAKTDPSDYEERFRTLPPDANPLDPGFLAPALAVDPNRGRFIRGGGGRAAAAQQHQEAQLLQQLQMAAARNDGIVIAGPPTGVIDPDLPLLEVLWRSALPWNTVEGVQQARPPPPP